MKDRLDVITLRGLSAVGSHGVFDYERSSSQVFSADLKLYLDARKAAETDDVQHTVDYGAIADDAVSVLTGTPVYLIETLANKLAEMALTYPLVEMVEVTIHKPMAPIRHQFSDVSVTIRRKRGQERSELVSTKSTVTQPGRLPTTQEPDSAVPLVQVPLPKRSSLHRAAELTALPEPKQFPPRASLHPAPVETSPSEEAPAVEMTPLIPEKSRLGERLNATRDTAAQPLSVPPIRSRGNVHPPFPVARSFADSSHVYRVVLALGSNQGDILTNLSGAVEALANTPGFEVEEVSPLVRTKPVLEEGALPQPDYYNAVVLARTVMAPPILLQATQYIESEFGRVPGRRWSARPLDIDIVAIDQMRVQSRDLTLPHPRAHKRAFVLYPWSLVDPDAVLINDERIVDLLAAAPDLSGVMGVRHDWLGESGSPSADEEELELAPRSSRRTETVLISDSVPTVEVRGEKLHLAPLEGDPIFQRLLDVEAQRSRARLEQEQARIAAKEAAKKKAEAAPPPKRARQVKPAVEEKPEPQSKPVRLPKPDVEPVLPPEPANDVVSEERGETSSERQSAASPARAGSVEPEQAPEPVVGRVLPDWRFSVHPQSTRVVDDTSLPAEMTIFSSEDAGSAAADETPGGTPRNGIARTPRPRVSRRVTLRPTPTGSLPVTRGTRTKN